MIRRLAKDIRESLREALDHESGKRTKAVAHRIKRRRRIQVEVGSGNIFADLGLPNAEEHLRKAEIAVQLHRHIKAQKLTLSAAAKITGIKPTDLSSVLRGHYQEFSENRLARMLKSLTSASPARNRSRHPARIRAAAARRAPRS